MPRRARLDKAGVLHHIMIRGIDSINIFRINKDRDDFIVRLADIFPQTKTACYAWAFMPNHAHFLVRSGPSGIAYVMRRLLTGYVVSFNHRHHRTGRLFQNRYKSIICQEDIYFKELVRYIHLNPLRAGVVSTLHDLESFPYSGHSNLMGRRIREWQDIDYTLHFFGEGITEAQVAYRDYITAGVSQGRKADLSGGGLIRSYGGWTEVRGQERLQSDQRILGDSDFVSQVLTEAEEGMERKTLVKSKGHTFESTLAAIVRLYNLDVEDILSRGRQKTKVEARSLLCYVSIHSLGMTGKELAIRLEMTPSAVGYAAARGQKVAKERNFSLASN
jgi:REP element-mobilizing transposase RayT